MRPALPLLLLLVAACAATPTPTAKPTPTRTPPSDRTGPAPELTAAALQAFAAARRGDAVRCYEVVLAEDPRQAGSLLLAFPVEPSGRVGPVEVRESTFPDGKVGACVAATIATWRTPFRPEEPVEVELPFSFAPAAPEAAPPPRPPAPAR